MIAKRIRDGFEREINLSEIDRPARVSRFEIPEMEIAELAESIKERGLLQAITVCEKDGRFEVVFGDRRFLAHKKLGLEKIRCRVREYTDEDIAIDRATENGQRANLSPVEQASEYQNLHVMHNMSWEKIGKMLGISGGVVLRRARVLKMHERIQDALHKKQISIGVGEELHRCPDETRMIYLLEMCIDHGVTTAVVRGWVNDVVADVRRAVSGSVGGGEEAGVYQSEIIFKGCALCKEPVDIMKMRQLAACPSCHEAIMKIIRGEQ